MLAPMCYNRVRLQDEPVPMVSKPFGQALATPAKTARPSPESVVLIALITICAILFVYLSVARHYTFSTAAYDLAMYDQAVWNTSQGRWFEINLLEDTMPDLTNKLGDHVEPILLPIALLYRLRANADVLLILQALALAALIWPLYHVVWHLTGRLLLAGVAVALYLAHPAMWNALLFDFHPVTLAAAFLMFALWMLIQKKRTACLIFALLAMACKEHIGLIVAMFGVYAVLFQKSERRLGAVLIAMGLAGSILAIGVVNPAYQPSGASYYLNRYSKVGSSIGEILLAPLTKPDVVWATLTGPKRISYYGDLLLPLGGLPLLGPAFILPVLPDIALNTFSAFAPARTLDAHYAVMIAPFLILAAIWGADRLAHWLSTRFGDPQRYDTRASGLRVFLESIAQRRAILVLASAWLIVSMAAYHLHNYGTFLPLSGRYVSTYVSEPRDAVGLRLATRIPAAAVVSAQFNLVPHISQRRRAHIFPRIDDAEYVFLDTHGVIEPFQTQAEYQSAVEALRNDPAFEVAAEEEGFILMSRR
ncbi:MAG TPA: DUF2079 domain-containing protein [Anaerolineae bacterium]|nr:DUF2079 domain-containing protein [Anaerolineae bacterium]